ncbi:sigma-70 family RNA polymerase sigma factor [Membranicola marinus]|uniref:Sigma-70 family RNA polymerase sigma factor n=1 Tax=Membranihabitans marinus TaxID=1227546 RepID=A0A953HJB4_9BACT|nr:sigma-70 family RNA polymerase sigma factor [Membranihabitans marinus]MBY5956767.1 sigma-70 family RNA polymerase sigma factor [Membranihabitans marinus]
MPGWKRNIEEDGFEDKFDMVYHENLDRVYRYVVSIIHHDTIAEDIAAEVFFTVWKKRETLLQYDNVVGLLYKISRDLSMNYLKSLANDRRKKEEFFHYYFGLGMANDEHILREKQFSALEQAIEQLPERCREVVRMKFLLGKSLKEIAAELHISVNTVQNHLTRGKFMIRELIQSDESLLILAAFIPGFL